ncbi:MAG: hypothetical protein DHS20C18_49320 [Saprospiraceae bacterium]|nr:MAG: hypothetical protein DHS20C18_49320 [Saprospiraceae bacterium]
MVLLFSASCEKDLSELNQDIKNPAQVPGESLFTSAQKDLVDQLVSTNVNYNPFRLFCQYWTQTTYIDESNYDLVTRNIPEQHWSELYRYVLKNLDEASVVISETEVLAAQEVAKNNKLQIIEILKVFTYSVLVESFGNIPYSEALDINKLLPKYDDGQTIYTDLLTKLDAALGKLDTNEGSFGTADNIYFGDVAAWKKFGNTIKLRMGMTLAGKMTDLAKTTVESAVAAGVFTSNEDNATMTYLSSPPNTNPLYIDLVASGRNDFVAANTLVDKMNSLEDPRRPFYFDDNMDDPATPEVEYVGGIYGDNNTFSLYTHIAKGIESPTFGGTVMDYAEVEFMLAEAVELGFNVGGTAEEHYNKAIEASILFWGGTSSDVDAYLQQAEVAYTTAQGEWQEKIGIQKWIALYNRGFAGWLSWRCLDYPVLTAPGDAVSDIPLRLTYPIVEQTLNGANWNEASTAIGGDAVSTRLFFDLD